MGEIKKLRNALTENSARNSKKVKSLSGSLCEDRLVATEFNNNKMVKT